MRIFSFLGKIYTWFSLISLGFLCGTVIKNPPANARDTRDMSSIPGLGRSPGGVHGNPLQYSCLENSIDRGAWWATVQGVTKSWIWLSDWTFTTHYAHLMWWKTGNTGVSGSRGWTWREAMLTGVMSTQLRGSGSTLKTSHKMQNQKGNLGAAKVDPKVIRAKCEPWSHRKSQQKMGQSLPHPRRHLVSVSSMLGLKVPKASVWTKHLPRPTRGTWSTKPLGLLLHRIKDGEFSSLSINHPLPHCLIMLASGEWVPGREIPSLVTQRRPELESCPILAKGPGPTEEFSPHF